LTVDQAGADQLFVWNFFCLPLDSPALVPHYVVVTYMGTHTDREWKKGSGEMLILSLIEDQPRHGYEIAKLIESRSGGALRFHVTTLYPLLYRIEKRGWIQGRWVEKPGQRRRRYYRLTMAGGKILAEQRRNWREFAQAIARVTGIECV
jgi:PadR family transcriptional regulator, regulatory protein PadR